MTKTDWTADPAFDAWVKTLPEKHWAKYDLSACRLGWEAKKAERIEADESAVPVAYLHPDGDEAAVPEYWVNCVAPHGWQPLFTRPPAQAAQNHPHSPNAADSVRVTEGSLSSRIGKDLENPRFWLDGLRVAIHTTDCAAKQQALTNAERELRKFCEAALAAQGQGEAVAWPARLVNHPANDGSGDRIVGFRVSEGDPILGEYGLSEPLDWLRKNTVDRQLAPAASPAGVPDVVSIMTHLPDNRAATRCELFRALALAAALAAQGQGEADRALAYVFGNMGKLDWKRIVDEKLTPPWPLKHHARAMGLFKAASPAGVPDGWALVPVKSTDAMHQAYIRAKYDGPKPVRIPNLWAAMLAAAPSAPEGDGGAK